jgi:hypothetical protein
VKQNPAGGAYAEPPGGYQRDAGPAFGAGTLDAEGHPLPPPCSVTSVHDYVIWIARDAVRCRTCDQTIGQFEYDERRSFDRRRLRPRARKELEEG